MKILVTGATGFLGHHVVPALRDAFDSEIVTVGAMDYNLLEPGVPSQMLKDIQPDCVVHLAAKSDGMIRRFVEANWWGPAGAAFC